MDNPFNFRDEDHKNAVGHYTKLLDKQIVYSNSFNHLLGVFNIPLVNNPDSHEKAAILVMGLAVGYALAKLEAQ